MAHLSGTWTMEAAQGYKAWLDLFATGVATPNPGAQRVDSAVKSTLEVIQDGECFSITLTRPGPNSFTVEQKFKLGEPYEFTLPSGIKSMSTTTLDGDKLITKTTSLDGKYNVESVREIVDDEMVLTSTCSGVINKQFFKKA